MTAKRRRGLSDLIGEVGNAPQEAPEKREKTPEGDREDTNQDAASEARETEPPGRQESGAEVPVRPRFQTERDPRGEPPSLPKYLRLERKEARLRGDQVDSLAALARRVNRQKASRSGERITENTLIRVAVDWLLSQEEYVGGSSEEELRRTLRVPEPSSRRNVGPVG